MCRPRDRSLTRGRGFTLLEVAVAFAITALALPVAIGGAAGGLRASREAARQAEALSRARSHLTAVADTGRLAPREESGDDGGGFGWRVRVTEVARADAALPSERPARRLILFAVEAEETWPGAGGRRHSLRLVSERFAEAAATRTLAAP